MNICVLALGVCCSLAAVSASACIDTTSSSSPTSPDRGVAIAHRVVVLGDSLAVSPSRAEGFPAVLEQRLNAQQPGWVVSNAGISGDTTSGGLRRFDQAVSDETRILILELGANDGLRGVDLATVERNLSTMIEHAQARGIRDFHQVFPRLAKKYTLPLVPFLLDGVVLNPDLNGDDEIHPNALGAQRIAETVWPYLQPMTQRDSLAPVR
jgi:acyl-CoA thioesterase-1